MAVADCWRGADGAGHVLLSARRRFGEREAECEAGRYRGCERATGPVRVRRLDAGGPKLSERAPVEEQVDDVPATAVSAGHDYHRRPHLVNPSRGGAGVVWRRNPAAAQRFGFRNVGRYD